MQTYFWVMNTLPDGQDILLGLLACFVLFAVGAVIHRVMGAGSFGPVGNAILVAIGIGMAIWINPRRHGIVIGGEMIQLGGLSALVSTMVLATAGTLKSWLLGPR